jgi:hypothetical protein
MSVDHGLDADDAAEGESVETLRRNKGSFLLGFAAGLVGGLVVIALVARRGKRDTQRGVYWGFALQVVLIIVDIVGRR